MNDPDSYTACLRDRPFGPIVERIVGLRLVDRRPELVLRRYVQQDGERWVKVYELEAEPGAVEEEGLAYGHSFIYQLLSDGPAPREPGAPSGASK